MRKQVKYPQIIRAKDHILATQAQIIMQLLRRVIPKTNSESLKKSKSKSFYADQKDP